MGQVCLLTKSHLRKPPKPKPAIFQPAIHSVHPVLLLCCLFDFFGHLIKQLQGFWVSSLFISICLDTGHPWNCD